jgi:hypothetical protein
MEQHINKQKVTTPCPKLWMGKHCLLAAGHLGPCQYTAG